jgi:hypothetical protein
VAKDRPLLNAAIGLGLAGVLIHGLTSHGGGQAGGGPAAASVADGGQAGYVDPLAGGSWAPARTDQGVDWLPRRAEPVGAAGPGVVIVSDSNSGWPGGAFISYRLTAGPARGRVIFIAEHLTGLLPAGTRVWAGRPVAIAHPGYPWIEMGWASCDGADPLVQYGGAPDGTPMPGGVMFARFARRLGATTAQDPGPGRAIPPPC